MVVAILLVQISSLPITYPEAEDPKPKTLRDKERGLFVISRHLHYHILKYHLNRSR